MTSLSPIAVDARTVASRQASFERASTTGMLLLLAAILMFFAALVSAWVVRRGFSATGSEEHLQLPFRLLILNTVVLLVSSVALALSHRVLHVGNRAGFRRWSTVGMAFGFAFILGQMFVCRHLIATGIAANADVGFFYILVVAHGLFFAGGLVSLAAITIRQPGRVGLETAARLVSMYWSSLATIWCLVLSFAFWGIRG